MKRFVLFLATLAAISQGCTYDPHNGESVNGSSYAPNGYSFTSGGVVVHYLVNAKAESLRPIRRRVPRAAGPCVTDEATASSATVPTSVTMATIARTIPATPATGAVRARTSAMGISVISRGAKGFVTPARVKPPPAISLLARTRMTAPRRVARLAQAIAAWSTWKLASAVKRMGCRACAMERARVSSVWSPPTAPMTAIHAPSQFVRTELVGACQRAATARPRTILLGSAEGVSAILGLRA